MSEGPLSTYRELRRRGQLKPDEAQELAAEKLQSLHNAVRHYRPGGAGGWRARLGLARRREEPPQGLYLFGPVGRGKSMMMDLFFDSAPVERKRRVHFHAFMQDVHDRLHRLRRDAADREPMPPLARELADEAWLLCFDELDVTDIADAMILGRLFTQLFEHGVVVVATSNRAPDDLYRNGLQRELFLPFIELVKRRLDVLALSGPVDFRRQRLEHVPVYHCPLGAEAEAALDAAFSQLTDGAEPRSDTLTVKGRTVPVPRCARGVAWFRFDDLCRTALGAGDYLRIATLFHSVLLSGVPLMGPENRNEARRFITLVDALYEHRVKLVCSAEAPPDRLYAAGDGSFEFQRTASRLIEMQSREYLHLPHLT